MDSFDLEKLWCTVCRNLQRELGSPVVNSWISPLLADKFYSGVLYIRAPSMFLRDWVVNNYLDLILKYCKDENKEIKSIEIFVSVVPSEKQQKSSSLSSSIGASIDPKFTFENFVVGKPNEFAHAAALRVAESSEIVFNPLFLHGAVGLGKTHLMHAIAWNIKKRFPKRDVVYMSAEKFMYNFIKSIRSKDTMGFKEKLRSIDVLMIDDIQFICGKDSTQEEFFHTFNALVDDKKQMIVSADKSPSDLTLEGRLKSRLGYGLVADIHPTTYELRLNILQSKVALCSAVVPEKVLEFIAHKITTNVRELEGALNRIIANAEFIGREITVDSAVEVLSDLLRINDHQVTVEEIQKKVASHYSIKFSDMRSTCRVRKVTQPRQVAMYLAKKLTSLSLPEIGKNFGGRSHATIIHAFNRIEQSMQNDGNLSDNVRFLSGVLSKQ